MDYSENLQMTSLVPLTVPDAPVLTNNSKSSTSQRYSCPVPICQFSAQTKNQLESHMEVSHPLDKPKFYCDICEKGFASKANRNRHKTNAHSTSKSSKMTHKVASTPRNLPYSLHHNPKRSQYKCKNCQLQFDHLTHLKRHELIGCTIFSILEFDSKACDNCYLNFDDYEQAYDLLAAHKRNCEFITGEHPNTLSCPICKKCFETGEELGNHLKNFEKQCGLISNDELDSLECMICGQEFSSIDELKSHVFLEAEKCRLVSKSNRCGIFS